MAKQKPTLNTSDIALLRSIFATKDRIKAIQDDLKKFATKDDLKKFATKDDLKKFATKDDLKNFATKADLTQLEQRLDKKLKKQRIDIVDKILSFLDKNFVTKEEFRDLETKISNLPSKEEFFKQMDKVIGEYKTFHQESKIILENYRNIRDHFNIQ
jgi:hypothetical protein